jgi:ferredoxin--NADP+ reductase
MIAAQTAIRFRHREEERMFLILEKEHLTPVLHRFIVQAPEVARKGQPGQFVIIRLDEKGERIPLTIADSDVDAGTLTLVVQEVGASTKAMATYEVGDSILDLVGPLGKPSEIEAFGMVVCAAGGVGIAPIYPITRALKKAGNTVISIIGARNQELLFWEEEMRAVSDELIVCTDDGSYGRFALVPQPLQ